MSTESDPDRGRIEQLAVLVHAGGSIFVVSLALAAILVLTLVLADEVVATDRGTLISSAFTVIGTVVGAYAGVKVGAAGREEAQEAREAETAKVQELAAEVKPEEFKDAIDRAERRTSPPRRRRR